MPIDLASRSRAPWTGSVDTVTATEEGRAFFQQRLAVLGLCIFVLAGGSWGLLALAYLLGAPAGAGEEHHPFSFGGSLHFANGLLGGVLWLAARRGQRKGGILHVLDLGTTLGLIAIWALSSIALPAPIGAFIALLSYTVGTLARAIVVPSTARRTLLIGALGGAMLVAAVLWQGLARGGVGGAIAMACWTTSVTTIATLASHTIFGLRRAVQEARVLGQYTLETKIGGGGMGNVWRASHALLRRPTAIKLLKPSRMGEAAFQRFEREVQLTARLSHPNTVAIYDYGRTRDGIFYYAMELLEGTDLERLVLEHGAQPPERVVHILVQVCSALAEAHDLGLVHRDVKPANILLSPRKNEHEFVKVVDFGLVKSIETSVEQSDVTEANTITGTPLYMSPEAIQAPERVDARSDLYALGAVAWFLLVGRPPFEGKSIVEVCSRHLHVTPERPSAALRSPLPPDLEEVVLSCLAKSPEERPEDARALRRRLEKSSAAGAWTAERASEWWRLNGASHGLGQPLPPVTPQTMTLDVRARAEGFGAELGPPEAREA
jgi:eukaryotic-like serine/threonine-protein kinase